MLNVPQMKKNLLLLLMEYSMIYFINVSFQNVDHFCRRSSDSFSLLFEQYQFHGIRTCDTGDYLCHKGFYRLMKQRLQEEKFLINVSKHENIIGYDRRSSFQDREISYH